MIIVQALHHNFSVLLLRVIFMIQIRLVSIFSTNFYNLSFRLIIHSPLKGDILNHRIYIHNILCVCVWSYTRGFGLASSDWTGTLFVKGKIFTWESTFTYVRSAKSPKLLMHTQMPNMTECVHTHTHSFPFLVMQIGPQK